jgi:hypothetical protein
MPKEDFGTFHPHLSAVITRFVPLAQLMLSFESIYESNHTDSHVYFADIARGEKHDTCP